MAGAAMLLPSDLARAQSVPTVDIAATCRAASAVTVSLLGSTGVNDFQVCMDGENKARETIIKDWSSYAASDRVGCIQPNVYLPTYIEWLTCIEMEQGRARSPQVQRHAHRQPKRAGHFAKGELARTELMHEFA